MRSYTLRSQESLALRRSRVLLWLIVVFVVFALLWAKTTQVDQLVRGEGKVIPSQQLQLVQSLEPGIVDDILVREGSFVEAGQVLLKLDPTQQDFSFQEQQLKLQELKAKTARLRAEVDGSEMPALEFYDEGLIPFVREELRLFQRRKDELAYEQQLLEQQIQQQEQVLVQARSDLVQAEEELRLVEKELAILEPLFEQGVVSEVELIRAQKSRLQAQSERNQQQFKLPEVQANIRELRTKLKGLQLSFRADAQAELNEVLAQRSRLNQSSGAMEDRLKRTLLRSPVRGTVKQLMVNTLGGVIQPGMDVVSIVPMEDSLLIEAQVKPSDIAFLYPGQSARVKFTAFDFATYGAIEAELVHISADTIINEQGEAFYLVRVATDETEMKFQGRSLPIIPGMVSQVDIMTGKKTVLDYLLKPVFRMQDLALTEP